MRQLFIILAISIALTACHNKWDNSSQANSEDHPSTIKQDSTLEDSIVLLHPHPDSIHYSGSITKVIYPSNRHICKDSLTDYSFDCLGTKLKIHVPCDYLRTDYLQYTEGQILTIHYPDSSTISILCGTQADLSIKDNKANGLYDKKVIIKGYQIIYANVHKEKLQFFNNAFDLLSTDIK